MLDLIPGGPTTPAFQRRFPRHARFALPPSKREIIRQNSFPNVPLTTHRGRSVRFYDDLLKNKIAVLSVMSAAQPEGCARLMSNLAQVQRLLRESFAEDVHFYSITTTPAQDTPEALQAYAETHGVRGKWWLLTGRPEEVNALRQTLGYSDDHEGGRLADFIRYGNEPRALWGACEATTAPLRIAEDVSFVIRRTALGASMFGDL